MFPETTLGAALFGDLAHSVAQQVEDDALLTRTVCHARHRQLAGTDAVGCATITFVNRIAYDEFGLFHENAAEFGLPYPGPPHVRRESVEVEPGRRLSALVWGDGPPELVLIHGGAQNAHTWDTVALALDRPLLAVDLAGHGHSDDRASQSSASSRVDSLASDMVKVIRALAPTAEAIVGMSLGGMTAICLADQAPELVRRLLLVDVTPGVTAEKAKAITDFVNGPATFADFDDILARTIEHNATRTEASLRRGILHNAIQLDDGSWEWRHRRHDRSDDSRESETVLDQGVLWDRLAAIAAPVLLVRGMRPQSVVDDADEREFCLRQPTGTVTQIAEAGHSVQGDTPVELARIIEEFAIVRP
ncbi:MAG: pimeloyl-ACP methyl ester carboxylesterase [Acidimicrobiales bacterium]|jgi:pimeloyl-ACP methyl ester carboxylesterase